MTGWLHFTKHADYRWPSGAVTEYNEGGTYRVKKEVEEAALAAKVAESVKTPPKDEAVAPPQPRVDHESLTLEGRRIPRTIVHLGYVYSNPGNSDFLPDASDPEAKRSEELVGTEIVEREAAAKDEKKS